MPRILSGSPAFLADGFRDLDGADFALRTSAEGGVMKFVKKSQAFALATAALCLNACMDIRAVDRNHKEEQTRAVGPAAVSAPWEIQKAGEFNEYRVIFKGLRSGLLNVERELVTDEKEGASTKVLPLQLGVAKGQAMDSQVEGGKTYLYHWIDAETGERIPGKSVTVKVPLDLKIDQEVTPDTDLGKILFAPEKTRPVYGEIFFLEKGTITTQGRELRIEADLIEGKEVKIRTFAPDDEAKTKDDPVNGGLIWISAKKAVGSFHFDLSGRQGHPGAPGKKPGPELKGKSGAQGRAGYASPGGHSCGLQPQNGGPGLKGDTGYPGESGGRGGNTARLTLRVDEAVDFHRTFSGEPGRGGPGGLGGDGGEGGDGGKRGAGQYPCVASAGPRGPQGDRGRHGDWGAPGKESPIYEWRDGKMEEIKRGDEP